MLSTPCVRWLVLALACIVVFTQASCPNKCSGHGACGTSDVCECKQNWMAGDCSLRVCPYTRAWVDAPQNDNDAHYYAECGNKGSCDRTTGICVCDAGYTGSGCRRQACPNDCSGHGTCEFIDELSSNSMISSWEQEKIMGCTCDPGFEGHDCAARMCPKGDDPVTSYDQYDMIQYVQYTKGTNNYGQIYLSYADPYGATWTTAMITPAANEDDFCTAVKTALRALPHSALKDITAVAATAFKVTRTTDASSSGLITAVATSTDAGTYTCKIDFPSAAGTSGLQNVLSCNVGTADTSGDGSQPKFSVLAVTADVATCTTGEYHSAAVATDADPPVTRKLTELATCSKRGLCDGSTGDCLCFAGHRGLACETQEALV